MLKYIFFAIITEAPTPKKKANLEQSMVDVTQILERAFLTHWHSEITWGIFLTAGDRAEGSDYLS